VAQPSQPTLQPEAPARPLVDTGVALETARSTREGRGPDPLIGRVVADRYRILGPVGRGGMGVVYKVEHLRIGKLMAMKLLTGELSRNRDVVRRFKREALAASRLASPNTVQVWDFGHADGLTYLVMELVQGDDLGKVLRRSGPMPWVRVAKIAAQVCSSLVEAHARGITHRDLKPENLILVRSEASELQDLVKVLDFGLAKVQEDDRPNPNEITTTGAIVGTPYYMAPEQIRSEAVDGRTDLYALGAVMYRALTGVPPFVAPTPMAVLSMHLTEPVVPPDARAPTLGIPEEASAIVVRALAKDPAERFQSATELRDALVRTLLGAGVSGGFLRAGVLEATDEAELRRRSLAAPATRREVSAYARRVRRNGIWAAALALSLAGAATYLLRGVRVPASIARTGEELEPNETVDRANRLPLGRPIRGFLGKRPAPDRGDVDVFVAELPATDDGRARVELDFSGLPNMATCVSLGRADGVTPPTRYCRPRARALHVPALLVPAGLYAIQVSQDRERLEGGERPPVFENVSDAYSLRVTSVPNEQARPGTEIEPDDTPATAQPVSPGVRVDGAIGWDGDEVDAEPERERHAGDLAGGDQPDGHRAQLVDVVVLAVDLERVVRAQVAELDQQVLLPDEPRGVVVVRGEVGRVGGDRVAHRGAARAEAEGLDGARRGGGREARDGERERRPEQGRGAHQNDTPVVMPATKTCPPALTQGAPGAFGSAAVTLSSFTCVRVGKTCSCRRR
jgi:serine/threonine-protein kinase